MKKLLLIVLILSGFAGQAQIVNIPDPQFKHWLVYQILADTNHDLEIDSTEAAAVTVLQLDNQGIQDMTGINAFINLTLLKIHGELITTLSLSNLIHLGTLELNSCNHLTTLTLNNLPAAITVTCTCTGPLASSLTSVNMTGMSLLYTLTLTSNKLSTLDLSALTNLRTLTIAWNLFTTLPDLSHNNLLGTLICGGNLFTTINVSGRPNLVELNFNNCDYVTSFNIHNCTGLTRLYCSYNPLLTSIDLTNHNLNNLQYVTAENCSLNNLNIAGVNSLKSVACSYNKFTSIDVSQCTSLIGLGFAYNPLLQALNLKNGPSLIGYDDAANGCPNLRYICIDEDEVNFVPFRPDVSINSYCSFTPGGQFYNTIKGKITHDINNNGCDAGDPVLANNVVKMVNNSTSQTVFATTNVLGEYSFYTTSGNFTITPQLSNLYYNFIPASATINFATPSNNIQTADFCMAPNGVHPDLEISILAANIARPGFEGVYQIVYKNKGTTSLSGNVELNFDDVRLDLTTAAPSVTTQVPSVLTWAYSNLQPFESRTITVQFHILPPPVNNINDTLNFTANITPVAGDEVPRDNSFMMRQVIRGSFDPNDKTCLEGDRIHITKIGDYLHYMIRFQNVGTDTAFNVVVKDLLTAKYDWNSFEMIKASHPCVLRQTIGNKLEFIFENIKLPPTAVNEPGSHGYIAFKIKTVSNIPVGDSIKNNASVYFDFNLPVVTNTATSFVYNGTIIPIGIEYFKGSIQSGKNLLNWKANCTSSQAVFNIERSIDGRTFSSIGNITASNTRCLQPFDLIDNNPVAGMNYYRIKMTDVDGKITYSSTIALLNKKAGFEIVNLLPNPVIDGKAILNIASAQPQEMNIMVTDASGRSVYAVSQTAIAGSTQVEMNFSRLAAGTYTITVYTSEGERKIIRFVKK